MHEITQMLKELQQVGIHLNFQSIEEVSISPYATDIITLIRSIHREKFPGGTDKDRDRDRGTARKLESLKTIDKTNWPDRDKQIYWYVAHEFCKTGTFWDNAAAFVDRLYADYFNSDSVVSPNRKCNNCKCDIPLVTKEFIFTIEEINAIAREHSGNVTACVKGGITAAMEKFHKTFIQQREMLDEATLLLRNPCAGPHWYDRANSLLHKYNRYVQSK
jgi:hypothetical protein